MALREHMGRTRAFVHSPSKIPAEAEWITEQTGPTVTKAQRAENDRKERERERKKNNRTG
jgi:hypothetical protein